jgi:hypothetical protein
MSSSNIFIFLSSPWSCCTESQIRRQIVSVGLFQYIPFASRAHDLALRKPNQTTNSECGPLPIYSLCVSSTWSYSTEAKSADTKESVRGPLPIYSPSVSSTWEDEEKKCWPLPIYCIPFCVSSTWSCCAEGQKYHARLGRGGGRGGGCARRLVWIVACIEERRSASWEGKKDERIYPDRIWKIMLRLPFGKEKKVCTVSVSKLSKKYFSIQGPTSRIVPIILCILQIDCPTWTVGGGGIQYSYRIGRCQKDSPY